ncbi:MAG TPA: radical SAM protein [Gammaproteobacteria bacterium]|nr:radical SAM protein [Gammaproteobacteria bacterium]
MPETSKYKDMRSGFLPDRIVHLHLTQLCNLTCLHCYSNSGPQQKTALDLESLQHALPLLKAEGYNLISISGGEPLTYPLLLPLIDCAHAHDFRVTMITNGLFSNQRVSDAASKLDGIAISFDGMATTHNCLRDRVDAFERASAILAWLTDEGHHVAAAISLTRNAIPELPDLVDHLVGLGATALQIRPTALAGRAKFMVDASVFTAADRARLHLVTLALQQELATTVRVQCDLAPARQLWQQRTAYATLLASCDQGSTICPTNHPLAELVNPLVITETGILKPIAYDFHPLFDVAHIETLSRETLSHYKLHNLQALQALIGGALAQLKNSEGLVDWFDYCARLSEKTVN